MSKNYKNNSKWAVHATDFEADLFTQGFVSQHTILVAVTVGCPSNGRRASSISDLPALAAQTSAGRRDCLLPPLVARCDAAQASPAHPTPSAGPAARNQLPPYYAKKMIPPTDIWGAPVGRLTCGPTKLTHT